jgi:hypothetical protein
MQGCNCFLFGNKNKLEDSFVKTQEREQDQSLF